MTDQDLQAITTAYDQLAADQAAVDAQPQAITAYLAIPQDLANLAAAVAAAQTDTTTPQPAAAAAPQAKRGLAPIKPPEPARK